MRKWTGRILVFLLLGAIVNVAVAWGIVIAHGDVTCETIEEYWRKTDRFRVRVYVHSRFGYRVVSDNDINAPLYALVAAMDSQGSPARYDGWLWWSKERTWDGGHIGVGWPAPALSATVTQEWGPIDEPGGRRIHTLLRHGYTRDKGRLPRALLYETIPMVFPYRPVWAGLTANSSLYAAVIAAAAICAGALKRAARLRRGLCPACAYPRGSSPVCTECGEPLPC